MRLIFIVIVYTLSCFACSNTKKIATNPQAFLSVRLPGNIPVDDNGNPLSRGRDTLYTIYIESKTNAPEWGYVWKGAKVYTVIPTRVEQKKIEIGTRKTDGSSISLYPADGYQLWQLELVPFDGKANAPTHINYDYFQLELKTENKVKWIPVSKITELASPPSY